MRRNAHNLGIGGHYNQLLAVTRGELIVSAAGDDIPLPHRVQRLLQAWDQGGRRADLIASHVIDLDQDGRLQAPIHIDDLARWRGLDDWLRGRPYVIGASHAFTRRMMERFGPMAADVFYEDQVMAFRAIISGGAITVDEPLLQYRRGGISGRISFASGAALQAWTARQAARHVAEMEQLLADARLAGCVESMATNLDLPLRRAHYLQRLAASTGAAERWQTLREAAALPLGWRLKKLLHASFPGATAGLKRLSARTR